MSPVWCKGDSFVWGLGCFSSPQSVCRGYEGWGEWKHLSRGEREAVRGAVLILGSVPKVSALLRV